MPEEYDFSDGVSGKYADGPDSIPAHPSALESGALANSRGDALQLRSLTGLTVVT
jgi:hypothetical protein